MQSPSWRPIPSFLHRRSLRRYSSGCFGEEFADLDAEIVQHTREIERQNEAVPESWRAVDLQAIVEGRVDAPEPAYLRRSDGQAPCMQAA